jgi:hypothetical protein
MTTGKKWCGKLTEDQVREIRRRHGEGERIKDLAAAFGVRVNSIHNIVTWRTHRFVV